MARLIISVGESVFPVLRRRRELRRARQLRSAVARGAALLDEREPGWHEMIDEEDINLPHTMPLDALYGEGDGEGGYMEYLTERILGDYLTGGFAAGSGRGFIDSMVYLGFWADPDQKGEQESLWRAQLRQRREGRR